MAPIAPTSARPKAPKASSVPTPSADNSRASAEVLSKLARAKGVTAAPDSDTIPAKAGSNASGTSTSDGPSRASSGPSRTPEQGATRNAPVEMSTQASAPSPRTSQKAARKLCRRASRRLSSVSVPGVTSRTTSRFTTDFDPRFFASAGSSICSAMATRNPLRISVSR